MLDPPPTLQYFYVAGPGSGRPDQAILPGCNAVLVCPEWGRVVRPPAPNGSANDTNCPKTRKGGMTMRDDQRGAEDRQTDDREAYERPTLTPAGSFTSMTGLNGTGPRDTLAKHQLL